MSSTYDWMMRELRESERRAATGPLAPYVARARAELGSKDLKAVQRDTARTWAGRALVSHEAGRTMDAHECAHESIEHAALSGDNALLDEIRAAFDAAGVVY